MATTAPEPQQTGVKRFEEKTVDSVLGRINDYLATGDIVLPPNYIPENAVRAGWLMLQDIVDKNGSKALEVCTKESIANAFLDMVIQGLSVVKKQCYFVVYGNKLSLDESYMGTITIAKRDAGVKEPIANIIYKGDEFEYEIDVTNGRKKVTKHVQRLENILPENIIGAYSIVTFIDGTSDTEIMTMAQIRTSWGMGGSKGDSPAHKKFPDQMAVKTVISRSLKIRSGSSDDSALMREDDATADVKREISQKANKKEIGFTEPIMIEPKQELKVVAQPEQTEQPEDNAPGF